MYAILVKEPGSEVEEFILGTAARSHEAALNLMVERADEYVGEQLELGVEAAGDYIITKEADTMTVTVFDMSGDSPVALITFVASAIVAER